MLTLGALPLAAWRRRRCRRAITGGVFQDFSPSPFHLRHVLGPLVGRMGAGVELEVVRPGYVPAGAASSRCA